MTVALIVCDAVLALVAVTVAPIVPPGQSPGVRIGTASTLSVLLVAVSDMLLRGGVLTQVVATHAVTGTGPGVETGPTVTLAAPAAKAG